MPNHTRTKQLLNSFWNLPSAELLSSLHATPQGLTSEDAHQRLVSGGSQARPRKGKTATLTLLLSQFRSPIILILLFAGVLSAFLHDKTNALIIFTIVLMSGLLGFWQEHGAADAVKKLLAIIEVKATLLRDGKPTEVAIKEIVPGDIVVLNAGDVVPGDSLLLESNNLFVNEAALTGETFPVEKTAGVLPPDTPLSKRTNSLFTGTYVVSGTGTALIVKTGSKTEFGQVSESLKLRPPETDFEQGIRRFGYLLMEVTLLMVIFIFATNVFLKRPVLDSFLFALALAVGLTPVPPVFLLVLALILVFYLVVVEIAKVFFYRYNEKSSQREMSLTT